MLTTRVNGDASLARLLEQHPLAGGLTGTVAIDPGGRSPWHADDAGPRIIVYTGAALSPVQRRHLALADGIVVADPSLLVALGPAHRPGPGPLVALAGLDAPRFLCTSSVADARAAWCEVQARPELARALGTASDPVDIAPELVDLAIELLVAMGN